MLIADDMEMISFNGAVAPVMAVVGYCDRHEAGAIVRRFMQENHEACRVEH